MSDKKVYNLSNLENSRILITGASGWLGLETLCLLNSTFPNFKSLSLTLAGSKKKTIQLHGKPLDVLPLNEITPSTSFDFIFHFAFATQDKLRTLGAAKYISINTEINEWVSVLSNSNSLAKKLILSSGAASKHKETTNDSSSIGIYADLKRNLESRFLDIGSMSLRLWNTSGHHMGKDPKYALAEFISKAQSNEAIEVAKNLARTYVGASSVLQSSISYLLSGGSGIVNSGGERIKLYDLAKLVTVVLDSSSCVTLSNSGAFPELDYISPKSEIPDEFWVNDLGLTDQILNTANRF